MAGLGLDLSQFLDGRQDDDVEVLLDAFLGRALEIRHDSASRRAGLELTQKGYASVSARNRDHSAEEIQIGPDALIFAASDHVLRLSEAHKGEIESFFPESLKGDVP